VATGVTGRPGVTVNFTDAAGLLVSTELNAAGPVAAAG
jgi:hypothetical protein